MHAPAALKRNNAHNKQKSTAYANSSHSLMQMFSNARDLNALSPISQKRLEIETPFRSTTNRKWPTGYRMVT